MRLKLAKETDDLYVKHVNIPFLEPTVIIGTPNLYCTRIVDQGITHTAVQISRYATGHVDAFPGGNRDRPEDKAACLRLRRQMSDS